MLNNWLTTEQFNVKILQDVHDFLLEVQSYTHVTCTHLNFSFGISTGDRLTKIFT